MRELKPSTPGLSSATNPKKDEATELKTRSWQQELGGGKDLPGRGQEGRVICKLCRRYTWGLASLKTCLRQYFVSSEGLQGAFLLYGRRSRSSGSALDDSGPVHSPGENLLCLHDWLSTARKLGDPTRHLHFSLISMMTSRRC